KAVEHGEKIVFLHAVEDGPASQSYGLQVAALAGIPPAVLGQARTHLARLEAEPADSPQMHLFRAPAPREEKAPEVDALRLRLAEIDPEELSPREALELLFELQTLKGSE
ncbi:MAG TPA: DNA mismatch repair protein MutS, partial [Xanthomonadales bacterium]|nr:DNA mismatch repair protein MutS [Xanthomonadales bacterium]